MKGVDINFNWFNANPRFNGRVLNKNFKWFNLFRKVSANGIYWGVGFLQIGRRHLLYIGHSGVSLLFIGTH